MYQKSVLLSRVSSRSLYRLSAILLLSLFCLNVVAVSALGSYDIRIGFIHLTAHELFKPILMMNGFFILALMIFGASDSGPGLQENSPGSLASYRSFLVILTVGLVAAVYLPSVTVNFVHHDWTHRHISAGINSLGSALQLFKGPQADGFYRPLTFLSLWLDYRLFGANFAGYHVQSIVLHIINSLLVAGLARALGFSWKCSLWACLLFAGAAVNFEPVLWPAARFDLLSAVFVLLALIFAIRYLRSAVTWALPVSLLCYALGVMNKESSYCYPLLVLFIICTHRLWSIPWPGKGKLALLLSLTAAITVAMILVRVAVYGNLGGYPGAESPHFKAGFKAFTSLLRAVPLPILGVNTTPAAPGWLSAILILLALLVLVAAAVSRGCFGRKQYGLTACALLVSVPVLNIIGWIGSPMQHARYLYLPAVFVMLLIASTLGKSRWSAALLGGFLLANAMGATSNIQAYRNMLAKTGIIADSVRQDWLRHPSANTICLFDIPDHPDGVFFFGSELVERIKEKTPNAKILRLSAQDNARSGDPSVLTYRWSDKDLMLHLQ